MTLTSEKNKGIVFEVFFFHGIFDTLYGLCKKNKARFSYELNKVYVLQISLTLCLYEIHMMWEMDNLWVIIAKGSIRRKAVLSVA